MGLHFDYCKNCERDETLEPRKCLNCKWNPKLIDNFVQKRKSDMGLVVARVKFDLKTGNVISWEEVKDKGNN